MVQDFRPNLILDQGLNLVASTKILSCFTYCCYGDGTTPTARDSGTITATRSGTTVTASAGFFEANDVGRLIKFDSDEEAYVTAFTSTTEITVSISGAVAASEFTIYYVDQIGLDNEEKRSNSYGGDGGDNGASFAVDTVTYKRTYIFTAQAGAYSVSEVGFSNLAAAANNLFSRFALPATVSLSNGQQLKVVYELDVALSPSSSTAGDANITGWTSTGDFKIEGVGLEDMFASGNANSGFGITGSAGNGLEPSAVPDITVSTDSSAFSAINTVRAIGGSKADKAVSQSYNSGDFFIDKSVTFAITEANFEVRSIALTWGSSEISCLRFLLDSAQTKANTHTLSVTIRLSWQRTLTN